MKRIKILVFTLLLSAAIFSCKKSFLDQSPSISIPVDKSITSEGDMLEAIAGMYRSMITYYSFGRNYPVFGDLLSDNVYLSNSNSNRFVAQNSYIWTGESPEALSLWQYTYFTILQTNRIINANIGRTDNVNYLLGEAYQARALCYFYLVNWFAKPYMVDSTSLGVPLVTLSANITGPLVYPQRSKVSEVYAQINSDLDSAYNMMGTAPKLHNNSSNYFSKYSARALQARAYLFMGKYASAQQAAQDVVTNGQYTLSNGVSAFNGYWATSTGRTDKLETICEIDISAVANNGVEGLDYIYNRKALGDLLVTDSLYKIYANTDMRRGLIIDSFRNGNQAYYVNKYQNATNTDRDQIKVIRYAEVLLTLAEAYARQGDNTNGMKYLNSVAVQRDPAFAGFSNLAGQPLVDTIIKERRKELAFEGLRFWDLARTNVAFVRENMGIKGYSSYPFVDVTDFRRLQPIPQLELNANKNITKNNGY